MRKIKSINKAAVIIAAFFFRLKNKLRVIELEFQIWLHTYPFYQKIVHAIAYALVSPVLLFKWYKNKRTRLGFRIKQRQIIAAAFMLIVCTWNAGSMFHNFSKTPATKWEYYWATFGMLSVVSIIMFVYGITYGKIKILESKHRAVGDMYGYGGDAREKIIILLEMQKHYLN